MAQLGIAGQASRSTTVAPLTLATSSARAALRSATRTCLSPGRDSSSAANPPIGPQPSDKHRRSGRRRQPPHRMQGDRQRLRHGGDGGIEPRVVAHKQPRRQLRSSAKPPSQTSPTKPSLAQKLCRPARQAGHSPHQKRELATTRSPSANWDTPAAHRDHLAGELMPGDARRAANPLTGAEVVEVGAADAGGGHLEPHPAWRGFAGTMARPRPANRPPRRAWPPSSPLPRQISVAHAGDGVSCEEKPS